MQIVAIKRIVFVLIWDCCDGDPKPYIRIYKKEKSEKESGSCTQFVELCTKLSTKTVIK